ncbi:hypothetical protein [Solimicrobium silvestre]|uniref:Lipoprotein n=1 Tax=Solimicrobium silvestre TaxID=2099400 RepID=A0A2S9GST4_9BURK|nr:hypothetical protein [Solimicrobium silvestre]PRC90765.1 hypothetical protein S2091_4513 [Solimicrobium silvestre]
MKLPSLIRSVCLTLVTVIVVSSLSGCVVVPARGYYGPGYYHSWGYDHRG